MLKAYEYRIFPTKDQEQFLLKTNGLCRLYWNTCLAKKQEDHKWKIGSAKVVFEELKPEAIDWCKEIDSTSLAAEWSEITSAFNNFFKSCNFTGNSFLKIFYHHIKVFVKYILCRIKFL